MNFYLYIQGGGQLRLVGSIEMYDSLREFWYDAASIGGYLNRGFPPASGFAVVRIPRNFTSDDHDTDWYFYFLKEIAFSNIAKTVL